MNLPHVSTSIELVVATEQDLAEKAGAFKVLFGRPPKVYVQFPHVAVTPKGEKMCEQGQWLRVTGMRQQMVFAEVQTDHVEQFDLSYNLDATWSFR